MVNLVKQKPPESLVLELKSGRTISKDRVIRESRFLVLQAAIWSLI